MERIADDDVVLFVAILVANLARRHLGPVAVEIGDRELHIREPVVGIGNGLPGARHLPEPAESDHPHERKDRHRNHHLEQRKPPAALNPLHLFLSPHPFLSSRHLSCHPGTSFCHPGTSFCHPGTSSCHPAPLPVIPAPLPVIPAPLHLSFLSSRHLFRHPGTPSCHPGTPSCRSRHPFLSSRHLFLSSRHPFLSSRHLLPVIPAPLSVIPAQAGIQIRGIPSAV